jgi:hypothetical protein
MNELPTSIGKLNAFLELNLLVHQTWTRVENYQIVIIFCLHCIRSLHSPYPIV